MSQSPNLEIELKLQAEPDDLETLATALTASGVSFKSKKTHALYFDTPRKDLRRAGLSLRVRRTGKNRVQTVKAEGAALGALLVRPEWERTVADDHPELSDAPHAIRSLLPADAQYLVGPVFSVDVTRLTTLIDEGGSRVEMVVDRGSVIAAGCEARVAEIELELKEGDPAALFAVARSIAAIVPVKLGMLTKAERGYRILEETDEKPVRGERGVIPLEGTAGDAFQAIASACFRQFRLNEDLLLRTGNPDALHQARVAIRRLRSALSIFRYVVADDRLEPLRGELRWLAALLGEARDIDVLIERTGRADLLEEARARAYAHVTDQLSAVRARTLGLDLAEWLAIGDWRTSPVEPVRVAEPAAAFASALLDRSRRRLKARGKKMRKLGDEARHEVRIQAKKLRYAAEFFSNLYRKGKRPRRARRFIAAIEELQEQLGDLNDMVTAPIVLARLGLEIEPQTEPDRDRMIEDAAAAYDKLMDCKPFWR